MTPWTLTYHVASWVQRIYFNFFGGSEVLRQYICFLFSIKAPYTMKPRGIGLTLRRAVKPRAAPLSQFPVSGASKFLPACRPKAPPHECPTGKPNILRIQRSPLPLHVLLDLRRGFVFEYLAVQSEQLDRMLRSLGCWQGATLRRWYYE